MSRHQCRGMPPEFPARRFQEWIIAFALSACAFTLYGCGKDEECSAKPKTHDVSDNKLQHCGSCETFNLDGTGKEGPGDCTIDLMDNKCIMNIKNCKSLKVKEGKGGAKLFVKDDKCKDFSWGTMSEKFEAHLGTETKIKKEGDIKDEGENSAKITYDGPTATAEGSGEESTKNDEGSTSKEATKKDGEGSTTKEAEGSGEGSEKRSTEASGLVDISTDADKTENSIPNHFMTKLSSSRPRPTAILDLKHAQHHRLSQARDEHHHDQVAVAVKSFKNIRAASQAETARVEAGDGDAILKHGAATRSGTGSGKITLRKQGAVNRKPSNRHLNT